MNKIHTVAFFICRLATLSGKVYNQIIDIDIDIDIDIALRLGTHGEYK